MANSKIVYFGEVLIDLTSDNVTPEKLLKNTTAHGANGEQITGTCTYDADTQDATATAAEILSGKTAYKNGVKITGEMKNNGEVSGVISTKDGTYTVPQGYHDGSGKVQIDATEQLKIKPENIRQGVSILGVMGTMDTTEGEKRQENKTVTPSKAQQTVVPDAGYTCFTQVIVEPIPYVVNDNSAGGTTITIG